MLNLYNHVPFWWSSEQADPAATTNALSCLLRVLVGIADSLLAPPEGRSLLADGLAQDALRTLFEVWVKVSANRGIGAAEWPGLWGMFASHAHRWRHRTQTVVWWSDAIQHLTARLCAVMSGSVKVASSATAVAQGDMLGMQTAIDGMPPGLLADTWHRLLHLVGPPNGRAIGGTGHATGALAPMAPEVHLEMMRCVGRLTERLLMARGPASPTGNSILRLFGTWLFDAADPSTDRAYSAGRSVAVAVLCNIFRTPQPTSAPFHRQSLLQFYFVTIEALLNPQEAPLVLLNSRLLLAQKLEGSLSIVLPLISALRRILCTPPTEDDLHLRKAATHHLLTLVCFPNHFADVPLQSSASDDTAVLRFSSVKHRLFDICMDAIAIESNAENLVMLLRATLLFVVDDEARRVIASSGLSGDTVSPGMAGAGQGQTAGGDAGSDDGPRHQGGLRKGSSLDAGVGTLGSPVSGPARQHQGGLRKGSSLDAGGKDDGSFGAAESGSLRHGGKLKDGTDEQPPKKVPPPPPLLVVRAMRTLLANLQVRPPSRPQASPRPQRGFATRVVSICGGHSAPFWAPDATQRASYVSTTWAHADPFARLCVVRRSLPRTARSNSGGR